jgi:hypothetical protein
MGNTVLVIHMSIKGYEGEFFNPHRKKETIDAVKHHHKRFIN